MTRKRTSKRTEKRASKRNNIKSKSSKRSRINRLQSGSGKKFKLIELKVEISKEDKIASGNFGVVFKGKLVNNTDVVVKFDKVITDSFNREANIAQRLKNHPNINKILGIYKGKEISYMNNKNTNQTIPLDQMGLVFRYCKQGSLKSVLDKTDNYASLFNLLDDSKRNLCGLRRLIGFMIDVANGLDYIQSKGCYHLDIAARNVLIDGDDVAKITDFGLSTCKTKEISGQIPIFSSSPELITKKSPIIEKSDMWSFGMLMFETFSLGERPFNGVDIKNLVKIYQNNNYNNNTLSRNHLSIETISTKLSILKEEVYGTEIIALIKKCIKKKPSERINFNDAKKKLIDIFEKLTNKIDDNNDPLNNKSIKNYYFNRWKGGKNKGTPPTLEKLIGKIIS